MKNIKDYLEELADFKRNCSMKFRADNGAVSIIQGTIQNITDEEEGYITMAGGLKIKVSQLIEVNGVPAQNIC